MQIATRSSIDLVPGAPCAQRVRVFVACVDLERSK